MGGFLLRHRLGLEQIVLRLAVRGIQTQRFLKLTDGCVQLLAIRRGAVRMNLFGLQQKQMQTTPNSDYFFGAMKSSASSQNGRSGVSGQSPCPYPAWRIIFLGLGRCA